VLLDLLRYAVHRCEHAVPLLWRIHALHHSDPDLDVTTSLRHHPLEILLASIPWWLAVIVLDIPGVLLVSYGLAVFVSEAFQHGNICLPERLERWLRPLLVTADMHRIHHSLAPDQANSNYGAVLSVWDRLFGTYTRITRARHRNLRFGVRELPGRDCLKPSSMILTPWVLARVNEARR
jgi:sterol desaturase/sphingolipid hydroxylase (fatty acid hydroxylase superfamily)